MLAAMAARIPAALAIVAVAVLISLLTLGTVAPDPYKVEVQLERFAPLTTAVPAGTLAGYISDLPITTTGGEAALASAQYSIAPILLDASSKPHDSVIGNFARPQDVDAAGRAKSLQMVKHFGNGVVLYRAAPTSR